MSSTQNRPEQVDALIIGAGVIGLWTAYHLARLGHGRIVVVDGGRAGGLASPRAAGMLRHHYSHPLLVEMAVRGHEAYERLEGEVRGTLGYRRNGYFIMVGPEKEAELVANVEMQRALGVDIEVVTEAEFGRHFPEVTLPQPVVIAHERIAAYVQPSLVIEALLHRLREAGVEVRESTPVTGMDVQAGAVTRVWTARGHSFQPGVVINCAGAWAPAIARMAGTELPVVVQRLLTIVTVDGRDRYPMERATLSHEPMDLYTRPEVGYQVMIGGRVPFESAVNPNRLDLYVSTEQVAKSKGKLGQLIRGSHNGRVTNAWAAIDGDTPDYQPVLGSVGGIDGLLHAAGFSGHGFKLAPVVAELMAEQIVYGSYRTMDARLLSAERFKNGRLFPRGYRQMGA